MVLEAGVDAREVEVAVVGNEHPEASVPGEVVPDRAFYDYDSKYDDAEHDTILLDPCAAAPTRRATRFDRLAPRAFLAVDAAGFSRVDFFVEQKQRPRSC